jgi:formylglycine-generating enzyme required for sulfatase activity
MNKTRLTVTLLVLLPMVLLLVAIARCPFLPFYYYHDYNVLKQAVLEAGCDIEHETVNHDITLEEIDFRIRTPSGWRLNLSFPDDRDMNQLCERPKGFLSDGPGGRSQVFSLAYLNERLKAKDVKLTNIGDILRRFDLIGPILQENYDNGEIPTTEAFNESELHKYLWLYDPWKPQTPEAPGAGVETFPPTNERSEPGPHGLPLRRVGFEVLTLNRNGSEEQRKTGHALTYTEGLDGGTALEMVQIPGGSFLMGTTFEEASLVQAAYVRYAGKDYGDFWHEGPPHTVSVPTFYMGKFEVTQAQWKAVSRMPKLNWDLNDRSRFKGDDRPVENVSWLAALEFCNRLTRATGRQYRLPTEAEWEYACRAGTATQFQFGDAITTAVANYRGIYPYGAVSWGLHRDETTAVGFFGAPNAFGLYDMHGNVGELCFDPWHDTYVGAPSDGSVWMENGDNYVHVVRGGGYLEIPADLRAASRSKCYNPTNDCYDCGFRVVAVARK